MDQVTRANLRLTDAIGIRVDLHRQRRAGAINPEDYKLGCEWIRRIEDDLEPVRRAAGYRFSRAYELCTARTDYTR